MTWLVLGRLVDSHKIVGETVSDHMVRIIGLVFTVMRVHNIKIFVLLFLFFLLKFYKHVTNHVLGIRHSLLHDIILLLGLLGIGIVEANLAILGANRR
jgi:preprotein translocase subunit SecF